MRRYALYRVPVLVYNAFVELCFVLCESVKYLVIEAAKQCFPLELLWKRSTKKHKKVKCNYLKKMCLRTADLML